MGADIGLVRWVWALLALVFIVVGIFTPGFILSSIGIGAGVAAAIAFLGLGLGWQLLAFVTVSAISLILSRPISRQNSRPAETVYGIDRVIGKQGIVIVTIDPKAAQGRVRVEREVWPADSENGQPIPDGSTVQVLAVRDTRLLVRPLPNERQEAQRSLGL